MSPKEFYLVGDDVSTARTVLVEPKYKIEDLKRAVGGALHVVQPLGKSGISSLVSYRELTFDLP